MKKYIWLALLLVLLAVPVRAEGTAFDGWMDATRQQLPPMEQESAMTVGSGTILRQTDGSSAAYTFPDGDFFLLNCADSSLSWLLPRQTLIVRSVNDDGTWRVVRNPNAETYKSTVFLESDGLNLVLAPPMAYEEAEHGCLQAIASQNGSIRITKREEGFLLEVCVPQRMGQESWNWFCLASAEKLVEWTPSQKQIWPGYEMTGQYRFCQKGFYQLSPESYDPTGEGIYFLNPASYIPAKFIATGGSRAADKMGIAMLDIVRRSIGPEGFIPISTRSSWLLTDFGIGHGYYDTRWSTDLALALAAADEKFYLPEFRITVEAAAEHLCRHIEENGFRLPGMHGLLPPDYSWTGDYKKPHCSLNHALAEALLLYKAGRVEQADSLVAALCEADWLRKDGNLKYGILPDGNEIGGDYPYLTYNDLVLLWRYYINAGRQMPPALRTLTEKKLAWMQKNGVTGYMKLPE